MTIYSDSICRFPGPDEASNDVAIRNVLDNRIEKLEQAIVVLKGHLQSLSHILRLPDEVLTEIVLSYQALFEPISSTPFPSITEITTIPYGWITITFVCRRLRYIALSCPRLWTEILMCPRWASQFFRAIQGSTHSPVTTIYCLLTKSCDGRVGFSCTHCGVSCASRKRAPHTCRLPGYSERVNTKAATFFPSS